MLFEELMIKYVQMKDYKWASPRGSGGVFLELTSAWVQVYRVRVKTVSE